MFVRVGALFAVLPMFSVQNVPVQLRVALSALMAFLIAPLLPSMVQGDLSFWSLIRGLFIEASIGLLLGFVCRLVFYSIEMAGGIISTEMGLTLSSEFNQFNGSMTATPGMILYWLALMLFFSLDLHHWIIAALQRSYTVLPAGGAHLSETLLVDVIGRTGRMFVIALQIAAPVMAVSFVMTLVFSVLGRAVPQMNVFSESFAVRTLVGLTVFGLTSMFMAQHIINYLRRLPEDMLSVARLLRGA